MSWARDLLLPSAQVVGVAVHAQVLRDRAHGCGLLERGVVVDEHLVAGELAHQSVRVLDLEQRALHLVEGPLGVGLVPKLDPRVDQRGPVHLPEVGAHPVHVALAAPVLEAAERLAHQRGDVRGRRHGPGALGRRTGRAGSTPARASAAPRGRFASGGGGRRGAWAWRRHAGDGPQLRRPRDRSRRTGRRSGWRRPVQRPWRGAASRGPRRRRRACSASSSTARTSSSVMLRSEASVPTIDRPYGWSPSRARRATRPARWWGSGPGAAGAPRGPPPARSRTPRRRSRPADPEAALPRPPPSPRAGRCAPPRSRSCGPSWCRR